MTGAALLARMRAGYLVTVRGASGAQYTGRVEPAHGRERNAGAWVMRQPGGSLWHLLDGRDIVRVQS